MCKTHKFMCFILGLDKYLLESGQLNVALK